MIADVKNCSRLHWNSISKGMMQDFPKINVTVQIHVNIPDIYAVPKEYGIEIAHYNSKVHLSDPKKN